VAAGILAAARVNVHFFDKYKKIQLVQKKRFGFGRSALVSTFSSRNYFRLTLPETAKNFITRPSATLPF